MEQLARLRKLKGLSMRALAQESGVSTATIYQVENGRREARPSTLRALARALGVEVVELLGEEHGNAPAPWAASATDEEFRDLVDGADPATLLLLNRELHQALALADERAERERLLARTDVLIDALIKNFGPLQPAHGWQQPRLTEEPGEERRAG